MSRVLTFLVALMFGATCASAGGRWGAGYMPNVDVVDQNGRTLHFYDDVIKDKIVVISFIYTSCTDICPLVTSRLAQVQDALGDQMGKSIFFVSVSIDPERDTPAKLKDYAAAFQSGPGWLFLTGTQENMDEIRFKLGERSRNRISQHSNDVVLGNDVTGEWERNSAFADLGVLALAIKSMDPVYREKSAPTGTTVPPSRDDAPARELVGQAMFIKACASCHTVGRGIRVGPDLKGVSSRRERSWILKYVSAPDRMKASGDPIALELAAQFKTVHMPNLGVSEADASDLLSYVEVLSQGARSAQQQSQGHSH